MATANNPYSNFGKTPQPQAPGPQQPTKYPFVGPAYRYWGEQPGFVYDPYRDSYRADPKAQRDLYESQGLIEKKPGNPGLGATLGGTLAVGGALALGQSLGQTTGTTIGGALGSGTTAGTTGAATGATTGAATGAATGVTTGATTGVGTGLATGGTTAATTGTATGAATGTGAGATGAATSASTGAGSSAASGAGGLSAGMLTGLGAGAVAAYYGPSYYKYGRQLAEGKTNQDSSVKTAMLTNPLTAWAVPIADALGVNFGGTGKDKRQLIRDKVRENLVKSNVVSDQDYLLKFSDGSSFDIGKDGGARLRNEEGKDRQYSDVDFKDPRASNTVAALNPLAAIITGGGKQVTSDFAGLYTNAVLNGGADPATVNNRIKELYAKHGINSPADAGAVLDNLVKEKLLDQQTANIYKNGLGLVYGQTTPTSQLPAAGPAPLQPGQTPQSTAAAASGGMIAPVRSNTRSPGIDKNGRRIFY